MGLQLCALFHDRSKRQTPNAKRQTPNAKRQTPNAADTSFATIFVLCDVFVISITMELSDGLGAG